MSERDDGGPAFPSWDYQVMGDSGGMTVRDYFAAAALPQILFDIGRSKNEFDVAAAAYKFADAMLAERAK